MTNDNARDYNNYKPYRTKAQKAIASATAKIGPDGAWRTRAPRSYHARKDEVIRFEVVTLGRGGKGA